MAVLPLFALSLCWGPRALAAGAGEGRWVWGDLHAHSGWSYDGCEDAEASCAPRGELPASDFYEQAAASGLAFAALTDHAEGGDWMPEGEGGPSWDVWEGQSAAVSAAEGGAVLPILGYEWSAFRESDDDGHPEGSHRTVLLGGAEGCDEARQSGFSLGGERVTPDSAVFVEADAAPLEQVSELWEALDAASESCPGLRWITFAHHSAYTNPQATDWTLKQNRPSREVLVEVASEHGSSECLDPGAEGCDFWYDEAQGYWPDGAVQTALDQGFLLGFVGGTDSHDARPGSLEDGPGSVGQLNGAGEVRRQFASGALTGVWLEGDGGEGPPSLDALFDGLEARATVASTGPRPDLEVYAEGADGERYGLGEGLPPSAMPATLHLSGAEATGWTLTAVELIGPGGQVLGEGAQSPWSVDWDGRRGDYAYLRLRYEAEDGEPARVWVSPWFAEGRCGCASSAGPAGWAPAFFALVVGLGRRARISARCRRGCA